MPPISVCYQASDSTLGDNNAGEFSLIYRNMSLWTPAEENICKVEFFIGMLNILFQTDWFPIKYLNLKSDCITNINIEITSSSWNIKKFGAPIACFTVQPWRTFFPLNRGNMSCETCSEWVGWAHWQAGGGWIYITGKTDHWITWILCKMVLTTPLFWPHLEKSTFSISLR